MVTIHPTVVLEGREHVTFEDGVTVGPFTVIRATKDAPVRIGPGTTIGSHVSIHPGTWIGRHCTIDDGCKFSGACRVDYGATLRYDVVIARGTEIAFGAYISPRVMFINRDASGVEQGGATVGAKVFIGTHAVIGPAIGIGHRAKIGACALVLNDVSPFASVRADSSIVARERRRVWPEESPGS